MYFYIEQMNEVPRIRSDNREIVVQRISPYLEIGFPCQTNVRHRLSVHRQIRQPVDQCRRDMLVQQQTHQLRRSISRRIERRFLGRPGFCPKRATRRA